jgi:hypothetical protein
LNNSWFRSTCVRIKENISMFSFVWTFWWKDQDILLSNKPPVTIILVFLSCICDLCPFTSFSKHFYTQTTILSWTILLFNSSWIITVWAHSGRHCKWMKVWGGLTSCMGNEAWVCQGVLVHHHLLPTDFILSTTPISVYSQDSFCFLFYFIADVWSIVDFRWMGGVLGRKLKSFFFFFGLSRVWTQGLTLARQAFYHLSHSTSLKLKYWLYKFNTLVLNVTDTHTQTHIDKFMPNNQY